MRNVYFTNEVWTIMMGMTQEDKEIIAVKGTRARIDYVITSTDLNVWFDAHVKLKRQLRMRKRADGKVAVEIWQRDCDMAEFTRMAVIDATTEAYHKLEDAVAQNAEGPYTLRVLSPVEAAAFKPESRDRALEAFEDGHPHVIYSTIL